LNLNQIIWVAECITLKLYIFQVNNYLLLCVKIDLSFNWIFELRSNNLSGRVHHIEVIHLSLDFWAGWFKYIKLTYSHGVAKLYQKLIYNVTCIILFFLLFFNTTSLFIMFFNNKSCVIKEHSMQKPVEISRSHSFENWLISS